MNEKIILIIHDEPLEIQKLKSALAPLEKEGYTIAVENNSDDANLFCEENVGKIPVAIISRLKHSIVPGSWPNALGGARIAGAKRLLFSNASFIKGNKPDLVITGCIPREPFDAEKTLETVKKFL